MQPPIRVFIAAENESESRRLSHIFEEAGGFVVAGLAISATWPSLPPGIDVRIVQANKLSDFIHLPEASAPTLYLLPGGSTQAKELSRTSTVLPANASSAQIRAAAMALAAGLQVSPRSNKAVESEVDFALVEPLTDRELHILNLLADGLSNPQIARRLNISRNTVKFHVSSIISKLGATSRTEAVTIGLKRGLIIL
jgi:DNA-binding CsgD family transcriptional regulator